MNFTLNIDDQILDCRTFTLDEYELFVEAKTTGNLREYTKSLLAACCKQADSLNKHQAELVLINLWARSIAQVHELDWQCGVCGKSHKVKVDFSQAQISEHALPKYRIGEAVLDLRYPKLFEDANKFDMVSNCITGLTVGSENLKIEDLTSIEINELIGAITLENAVEMAELLVRPRPIMGIPINCECGEYGVHVIDGLSNFFRLF
ncbi:baseplate hub subunit [Serratia phage 4S]|nr:baseplate hub subunit [Serratia phage 4S]